MQPPFMVPHILINYLTVRLTVAVSKVRCERMNIIEKKQQAEILSHDSVVHLFHEFWISDPGHCAFSSLDSASSALKTLQSGYPSSRWPAGSREQSILASSLVIKSCRTLHDLFANLKDLAYDLYSNRMPEGMQSFPPWPSFPSV